MIPSFECLFNLIQLQSVPYDVQYFDEEFTKSTPTLTPIEDSVTETMDQTLFKGFSYTNPKMTD